MLHFAVWRSLVCGKRGVHAESCFSDIAQLSSLNVVMNHSFSRCLIIDIRKSVSHQNPDFTATECRCGLNKFLFSQWTRRLASRASTSPTVRTCLIRSRTDLGTELSKNAGMRLDYTKVNRVCFGRRSEPCFRSAAEGPGQAAQKKRAPHTRARDQRDGSFAERSLLVKYKVTEGAFVRLCRRRPRTLPPQLPHLSDTNTSFDRNVLQAHFAVSLL